jgi:hypothetical protein
VAQQVLQGFNYAIPITPSDTLNSPQKNNRYPDALWVGGAGIVVAVQPDGSTVNFTVVAGTLLPFVCTRVNAATTTATLILGLWQL